MAVVTVGAQIMAGTVVETATLVETEGDMEAVTDQATTEMGGIEMEAMGK